MQHKIDMSECDHIFLSSFCMLILSYGGKITSSPFHMALWSPRWFTLHKHVTKQAGDAHFLIFVPVENGFHSATALCLCKTWIHQARYIKSMFFNCYYISFQDMHSFFQFLLSVINHYHINRLHLFWDSFEWFCLQISSNAKIFFLSCPRHCDRGLIVVIVYYFQIWNKKEHNNIVCRFISSHMGPIYIQTYIYIYIYIYIYSWCNDSHQRKRIWHPEFRTWTRLYIFFFK